MTKEEIKGLISATVAGQGDQVDAGGALSEILNGIIDAIPEGGGGELPILQSSKSYAPSEDLDSTSSSGAADYLGISVAEFSKLVEGGYAYIRFGQSESKFLLPVLSYTMGYNCETTIGEASKGSGQVISIIGDQESDEWNIRITM